MRRFLKYCLPLLVWLARDLHRLDGSHVGRTHVAIHRSILTLAETGYFSGDRYVRSFLYSKMRAHVASTPFWHCCCFVLRFA